MIAQVKRILLAEDNANDVELTLEAEPSQRTKVRETLDSRVLA